MLRLGRGPLGPRLGWKSSENVRDIPQKWDLGLLGAILVVLGAILGPSWPTWGHLGRSWGGLGQSWGDRGVILGPPDRPKMMKTLGTSFKNGKMAMSPRCCYDVFSLISTSSLEEAILNRLGAILARLRGHSGPSWGHLGRTWGNLGAILGPYWANLGPSCAILGPSWSHLRPYWGFLGPRCGPRTKILIFHRVLNGFDPGGPVRQVL